jgi:hypothetical protein
VSILTGRATAHKATLSTSFCYLKPYYLDPNVSYFDHVEDGRI